MLRPIDRSSRGDITEHQFQISFKRWNSTCMGKTQTVTSKHSGVSEVQVQTRHERWQTGREQTKCSENTLLNYCSIPQTPTSTCWIFYLNALIRVIPGECENASPAKDRFRNQCVSNMTVTLIWPSVSASMVLSRFLYQSLSPPCSGLFLF